MAAGTLIDSFHALSERQYIDAKRNFEKALLFARGTIGTEEIREHLAINMLKASQSKVLENSEIKTLYLFAIEEMEKQVEKNSKKNLKIKHNILLGQLYSALGLIDRNPELIRRAMDQYRISIKFAPNYIYVYPLLANLLAQTGNIEEAIILIEKVENLLINAERYDINIFYTKPLFYTVARKYDKAYKALKKISIYQGGAEHRLNSEKMMNILNVAHSNKGEDTILFLEKVYLLDKKIIPTALLLAQLHAESGNPEKARFYANEALKQDNSLKVKINQFFKALDEKFKNDKNENN
jgi:tetratricopeptide (TPR) repeat protein